jgi:hypothetical protein
MARGIPQWWSISTHSTPAKSTANAVAHAGATLLSRCCLGARGSTPGLTAAP